MKPIGKTLIMTILAATLTIPCIAAPSSQTIFGFELGKPVSLGECPYRMIGTYKAYEAMPQNTCVEEAHPLNGYGVPVRRVIFSTNENPLIVKNSRAFLLENGGVLIGFHFLTRGYGVQDIAFSQLKEKFGKPTSVDKGVVQNLAGAKFSSISAQWKFNNLHITFDGMSGNIESGEVFFDLPEATRLRSGWVAQGRESERKM